MTGKHTSEEVDGDTPDLRRLWQTAVPIAKGIWRKTTAWWRSTRLTTPHQPIDLNETAVEEIAARFENGPATALLEPMPQSMTAGDASHAVDRIRLDTEVWNRNNVTRTQAYWNMYRQFPELHWALLAHLVSRNGGWSMTDLKGEWLPHILSPETAAMHFDMLETCNALIFRDAYPQLKLYAESRRFNTPLFAELPMFGVSAFMRPFWERFWESGDAALLTVSLIVNEQHVIQRPVVDNPKYRNTVLDTAMFRSLPLFQTNQIVFPLAETGRHGGEPMRLAGRVLERFDDLKERIAFGKCLYALLFGYPRVLDGATAFGDTVPHTGSRADYWPQRFSPDKRKTGGSPLLWDTSAGRRWYSPPLARAWPDRPLPDAPARDWFTDLSALSYVSAPRLPYIVDMTDEFLLGQRKQQAAAAIAGPS